MANAPKRKTPPTLKIDINDQFAWMRMLVALTWGGEPRKMDQALATLAAEGLGVLHELKQLPFAVLDLQALSRALDLPAGEVARMPGAATFYQTAFTDPVRSAADLSRQVFYPAGHFRTVAQAPGLDRLLADLQRANDRGAYLAGILLLLIATMAERHPEISASLNRAVAAIHASSNRGVGKLPSDRTLMEIWKTWRHLAPLWAAYALELQRTLALGFTVDAAGLEVMHDPERLRRILSSAAWFRSFAESFSSERAGAPLIPPGKALRLIADVEKANPELEPLTAEELAAAKAYLAPTRKFFSQTGDR
jgi:hypothetical protein